MATKEHINEIMCCDVMKGLKNLDSNTIDCIITSPPYFRLRDYGNETKTIWDDGWYGQLGLEPTLDLYLSHLWQITDELYRVLKPTGVVFWNHGDSYSQGEPIVDCPSKCLMMQNYRLILGMIDVDYRILVEWRVLGKPAGALEEMLEHPKIRSILRSQIVWYKLNHMPSSAKDRFTSSYEPVFVLAKNKKYWFDLDAVRVPHKKSSIERSKHERTKFGGDPNNPLGALGKGKKKGAEHVKVKVNPSGKNPGDLWMIPTQPFPEAHFATFPEKLIEPMVRVGCPKEICKKCGRARIRITKPTEEYSKYLGKTWYNHDQIKRFTMGHKKDDTNGHRTTAGYKTIGWTDCGCNAGFEPGIVLDPFMGAGTTALVALRNNCRFIGIELNSKYVEIAYARIKPYLGQRKLEEF
jgi:DNA modification methylase